ncbi:MAG: ribonuclease III domain-containing protein [Oscillospiraceae bacterium]
MDTKLLNPLTLAFMGDAVYEQLVRLAVIEEKGSLSADKLHKYTVERVRASAQAEGFRIIEAKLTEEEIAVYKRVRISPSVTVPKSATAADYRAATGIEALFGWLYLNGETDRINHLFKAISGGKDE